ncbi:MAG: hypothetical protein O3B75_07550 [Planctomycetota bacterium]|nr:hypothetical protein [Planctomycetota bacterium]
MQLVHLTQTLIYAIVLAIGISASATRGDGPVSITLEHFGVGGHFRPGDIVAARFQLQGQIDQPTPIEIAWELPDGNGDISQITRQLVLDPGQPVSTWLYARIPPKQNLTAALDEIYTVRVWAKSGDRRTLELGSARISPRSSVNPTVAVPLNEDIFGVIGKSGPMGLDSYATPSPGEGRIHSMNEITKIARGIRPQDLPDRWEGLSQFSALIWTQESPKTLTSDCARALREWIGRGGIFVVVLPETAEPWGVIAPISHPLTDLMPDWKVERVDGVPVRDLLPVVSQSNQLLNPKATMSVTFFVESGKSNAYEPLILCPVPRDPRTGFASPQRETLDGKILAITRSFGHGRVTVIGLDVDGLSRRALQSTALPRADVFWNRILARRADTPTNSEYQELQKLKRLVVTAPSFVDFGRGDLVDGEIGMRGEAAVGILAAFLLFLVYWVIAGPGGFGLLKWMNRERHSWAFFVATALVFGTGIWIIGGSFYSSRVRVQHLTVLDSIWRSTVNQPTKDTAMSRATSWFSAYLPGYGQTNVSIDPESERRNVLTGWSAPGSMISTFPNPARSAVPIETPNSLQVTARATSASFQAQWMGVVPSDWGKAPFTPDPKRPLEQTIVPGDPLQVMLTGLVEHSLPGPLRDVGIIHITPIRNRLPKPNDANAKVNLPSDALPNIGRFKILSLWKPHQPIEIKEILYPGGPMGVDEKIGDLENAIQSRYQEPFINDSLRVVNQFGQNGLGGINSSEQRRRFLDMLGIYNMLQPPDYVQNPPMDVSAVFIERILGRSFDISAWFTTPCLILWGYLDAAECPVPIIIDGEKVPSSGLVLVRVVFPLPVDEKFAAPERD